MEKDKITIQKVAFLAGCFLNYADELQTNTLFKHEFKKKTNAFSKFMSNFEAQILNIKDEKELKELSEQLHNSYLAIDNMISIQFNLKNKNQRDYFNFEINELVNKFNLNEQDN